MYSVLIRTSFLTQTGIPKATFKKTANLNINKWKNPYLKKCQIKTKLSDQKKKKKKRFKKTSHAKAKCSHLCPPRRFCKWTERRPATHANQQVPCPRVAPFPHLLSLREAGSSQSSLGALKCCYLYNPVSCLNPMNDDFTGD